MDGRALPNFFIVGTGKAGTTSLYHYLKQHPQIYMSPIKEPCYFASEIRIENLTPALHRHIRRASRKLREVLRDNRPVRPMGWLFSEWEEYVRLFHSVEAETAVGEASVAYLWSETAAANIASRIPGARIVMILRDPADRAFSQYLHQLTIGLTRLTFRQHIERCMRNKERRISAYYPLLEIGLYYEQVKRYLDRFPPANVRIYWYEESWRRPDLFLADLFEFLNVDPSFQPDTSRRSLVRKSPRSTALNYAAKQLDLVHNASERIPSWLRPSIRRLLFRSGRAVTMDRKDRQFLIEYYREDASKLASLLNRDLSGWLR